VPVVKTFFTPMLGIINYDYSEAVLAVGKSTTDRKLDPFFFLTDVSETGRTQVESKSKCLS
jgi:hypothetical protein